MRTQRAQRGRDARRTRAKKRGTAVCTSSFCANGNTAERPPWFFNSLLKPGRLREEDVVFQVDMLVEVFLELLELPVRDHKGIADIVRDRIPIGKVTDGVDCITDLLMLMIELDEGRPDGFHI